MTGDCWMCCHSIGAGQITVRHLILKRGYTDEHADERKGTSIVCQPRRVVNCKPCAKFEREPGADDD